MLSARARERVSFLVRGARCSGPRRHPGARGDARPQRALETDLEGLESTRGPEIRDELAEVRLGRRVLQ